MSMSSWTIEVRQTGQERATGPKPRQEALLRLKARFATVVVRPGDSFVAFTMELEIRGVRPVATAIRADAGLSAELLRTLPLSTLARYAAIGGLLGFGEPVPELQSLLRDAGFFQAPGLSGDGDRFMFSVNDSPTARRAASRWLEGFAKQTRPQSVRGRPKVVTDELLSRVASVYREAMSARLPPKKAVQASEGVSEATAGRYIMRARERGFLGKTDKGKKGETGS
jgi:hypothetical protein